LVTLRDDEDPAFVVLTVGDEGDTPDPAALRDAHRPFFTTRAGRLGLGASLAARYAASMGGRFVLRREGARTLAELRLPRKRGT
jgi:C4-dicarboxylate-specific signal transduction histidine kinase